MKKAFLETKWYNWIPILPIFIFKWSMARYFLKHLQDNDPYQKKTEIVFIIWLLYQVFCFHIVFLPLLLKLD
jgi:hypothetical protein